jgi:hypothetical protein
MELVLKIYDKTGKTVEREAKGETCDIMFGTIQSLMELCEITEDTDKFALLKKVAGAYNEITFILSAIFTDVTEDEWKRVKVKELLPLLITIFKAVVSEIMDVPVDSKNLMGA